MRDMTHSYTLSAATQHDTSPICVWTHMDNTITNESWHTNEWVMSHIWMSHVTHMNESRHAPVLPLDASATQLLYEWGQTWMTHIRLSHGTHMTESCHTPVLPLDASATRHDPNVTWNHTFQTDYINFVRLEYPKDGPHSCAKHYVVMHKCDTTALRFWQAHSCVWRDSLIRACDMTHSFVLVTWLTHVTAQWWALMQLQDTTLSRQTCLRSHVWHDACVCDITPSCVGSRVYGWQWHHDTTHSYVWHDLFICGYFLDGYCSTVQGLLDWFEVDLGFTELLFIQIDLCVMCVFVWHDLFMCGDMTHPYARYDSFIRVT